MPFSSTRIVPVCWNWRPFELVHKYFDIAAPGTVYQGIAVVCAAGSLQLVRQVFCLPALEKIVLPVAAVDNTPDSVDIQEERFIVSRDQIVRIFFTDPGPFYFLTVSIGHCDE